LSARVKGNVRRRSAEQPKEMLDGILETVRLEILVASKDLRDAIQRKERGNKSPGGFPPGLQCYA
jgi:hypothetical protein